MWLTIEPREPLLLGEMRADFQFLTSRTYIPARVLRGAWAEWLARKGLGDAQISETVSQIRIGNFFPAAQWGHLRYALPMPLSALSCKLEGGFISEPLPENRGHGVVDVLLPRLAYKLLEERGARFAIPFSLVCQQCGDRMELFEGFYAAYWYRDTECLVHFRPQFHGQTKVALSRYRRASSEGMLYTASALSPKAQKPDTKHGATHLIFLGQLHVTDHNALESLKEALACTAVGALHTRGYGRVHTRETEADLPPLTERFVTFNQALSKLWQDIRRLAMNERDLPQELNGCYFSLDLLAPGVFHENGVPTLVPTLSIDNQQLKPIFWMTSPEVASGWSSAWGLPKPTDLAACMGSVYVYHWDSSPEALLPALETLEREWVGQRRDEGFGECLICHPFHQEVEEK